MFGLNRKELEVLICWEFEYPPKQAHLLNERCCEFIGGDCRLALGRQDNKTLRYTGYAHMNGKKLNEDKFAACSGEPIRRVIRMNYANCVMKPNGIETYYLNIFICQI